MSTCPRGAKIRRSNCRRLAALVTAVAASALLLFAPNTSARAQAVSGSPGLVISQVSTRGGEPGATFQNDFVEIFNRGNVTVNLGDYSLQVLVNAPPSPPDFPGGLTPVTVIVVSSGAPPHLAPGQHFPLHFPGPRE